MTFNSLLAKLYTKKGSATYLASPKTLYDAAKKIEPSIKLKHVIEYLESRQKSYLVTSEKNKHLQNRYAQAVSTYPYQNLHCDLAFFSKTAFTYLLCRDTFSGMSHAAFMGNSKNAKRTLNAFKKIENDIPYKIGTVAVDSGSEFSDVKNYLKSKNVKFKQLKSFQHAFMAEKLISDVKKLFRRYQQQTNRKDIRKILKSLISTINKRKNRNTGFSAIDALKVENHGKVFENRYGKFLNEKAMINLDRDAKFKIGQEVRISNIMSASQKSNLKKTPTNFSTEVFYIKERHSNVPITYTLVDNEDNIISRPFYEHQLIKA